ncbi:MAG: hypothetical protein WAS21_10500 [Geminicoccaceae bacterium]
MPTNPRSIALQVAIEGADRAIRALRDIRDGGEEAFQRLVTSGNQATAAMERLDRGLGQVKGGNHAVVFQQLGYQIGDFAVQVQSGQNAVTAFVQQGSQIAGAFGPVGAVLGAAGAVAIGLAGYLTQTGQEASTAATELDKLREGTQAYKTLLEEIRPLQQAFLEGLVQQQSEAKAAADRQAELNDRLQNSRPEFTGGKLKEPTYDELVAQTNQLLPRQGLSPSEYAGQQLRRSRPAEDRAITQFVNRDLTAVVGTDQAKPGYEETAQYQQEEQAAARAAAAAKTAADAADRQAQAARNLIAQMELEAGSQERLASATLVSAAARQREQIEADKERKILEASRTLKGEQLEHYKELAERVAQAQLNMVALNVATQASTDKSGPALRNRAERGSMTELAEFDKTRSAGIDQATTELRRQLKVEQVKAATAGQSGGELQVRHQQRINELLRQGVSLTSAQGKAYLAAADAVDQITDANEQRLAREKEAAARQSEILLQPWKDLVAYSAQATSDIFDEMLDKGEVSAGKLASGFQTTMRKSLAGLAGNVVTEPFNQAVIKFGDSLTETIKSKGDLLANLDKTVQDNPAMAGGAFGFLAGTALDAVRQKNTYAGIGGAVGGAAGAVIGSYLLPGVGTYVGGAVGSAAGAGLGSLFSAGGGLGNDNSQQSYVLASRKIEYTDKSASSQNRAVTSGVLGQIATLQESLAGLGATFKNTALNVQAGNKSGYQLNGVKYGTEQDLLQATIKELLKNAGGLSASQQTVLKNTRGRSTQEVLSDVEFAKQYDRLTFKGTAFAQSLQDLDQQFTEASRKAKDLGLDTQKLAEAQGKARQDLIEQGKDQLTGMESQLRGQVQGINSFFEGLIEPLRSVANDNAALSPLAQINAARTKFRDDLALAQGGDVQGTRDLAGAAQTLQQLSQRYLGSSGLGAEIAREIRSGTTSVTDRLQQEQAETLASLPQVQRETTAMLAKTWTDGVGELKDEIAKLRQELRQVGGLA